MIRDFFPGAASIQSLLPSYYKPISLALYEILEDSGASIEVRNLWKESFTTKETLGTIAVQPECSLYYFGSSREGTTNVDMEPDEDVVGVDNRFPVITDCSDVPGEKCLLLVHDDDTQAGYAKLQLVYNRVPLFQNEYGVANAMHFNTSAHIVSSADKYGRLVISFNPEHGSERHGPAICKGGVGRVPVDIVNAFNLSKLPGCVEERISRTRDHNWPSANMTDNCESLGCLFVPVGHPHSHEQSLEWRYSLSHQERLLVSHFSSVQHKCYILLKLWKKDVLPSWVGPDSLSSYHCKTCMFYMIENSPSDFWRPDNLLSCFVACLRLFLLWTMNGICPNYFIPAENMFDRRIHGKLKQDLQQALQTFLTTDCKYLIQIRTGNIGDQLVSYVTMPVSNRLFFSFGMSDNARTRTKAMLVLNTMTYLVSEYVVMQKCFSVRSQRCLKNIYNFTQHLKHTNTITKHTAEETKRAISLFLPCLELHLMTGIIALAEQQGRRKEKIWQFLFSDSWHQLSLNSAISVKLKQASLMYMFEYYHATLDVLSSIELRGVYSFCCCYDNTELMAMPTKDEMIRTISIRPNVTVEHIANRVFLPCIVFFQPREMLHLMLYVMRC